MFLVTCDSCGNNGFTEDGQNLDDSCRCSTEAGNPPGSIDGCCSTAGHTHDEHIAHVKSTGDASNRPVTITIVPGSTTVGAVS